MHSNRSMSSTLRPVLLQRVLGGPDRAGQHPDRVVAAHADRWWIRARGVSPCSATARSDAISSADDASQIWDGDRGGDPAAGRQRLQAGHLLQRRLARALVGGEVCPSGRATGSISSAKRPSAIAGPRALVGREGELLHLLAADVPLLGDHLGRAELADLLVAVPLAASRATRRTAWRSRTAGRPASPRRSGWRTCSARRRRRRGPGCRTSRPGPRSAPPAGTSRTAGRWSRPARGRAARPPARRCARRRRPASRWCRSSRG